MPRSKKSSSSGVLNPNHPIQLVRVTKPTLGHLITAFVWRYAPRPVIETHYNRTTKKLAFLAVPYSA